MGRKNQLSTKGTEPHAIAIASVPTIGSQVRPIVFTILGTGISGFILWGISEFLSLRGVVNLAASRIMLLLIWVASTLGACAVVRAIKIRRKVLAVSLSSVVLACSLLVLDVWAPKPSVRSESTSESPIEKTDSFSTLVPFQGESKNAPIPMDINFTDPHSEFYASLFQLANRSDKQPEGWPAYKNRKFESPDERIAFVTRLMQVDVFRSIYVLQAGVSGISQTEGVGLTPIHKKPIVPPDGVPYPAKEVLALLSDNEFFSPIDYALWNSQPLMPIGTHVSFIEHANPEKGEVFTCIVRLERPGYFRIDFEIQPGLAMNNTFPAGFSNQRVQGTTTYSVTVSMKYEIQRKNDDKQFHAEQYAIWADSLFDGLQKQMGF